jgi:glycosyltransferase involved in cell wall biosynthesis
MILFVHLLNDRSGSPRVLKSVVQAVVEKGLPVKLVLGSQGSGILSELSEPIKKFPYRRFNNRALTFFSYIFSQSILFFSLLLSSEARQSSLVYINTVLPFGAALFAKICGIPIIYHVHEIMIKPAPLAWWLKNVIRMTASKVLYVSKTHADLLPIKNIKYEVLCNGYDPVFSNASKYPYQPIREGKFRVLMLASLRGYKGVPQFLELAQSFVKTPELHFDLVLNDELDSVREFIESHETKNLSIHPRVICPTPYYQRASLVLNLSPPDICVETFGLTILEAMVFGVPVIAPPVGGPAEVLQDGVQGYLVDSRDMSELIDKVKTLSKRHELCMEMSSRARDRASEFSPLVFSENVYKTIIKTMA